MAEFWREKVMLAKIEVTEGVDPTPGAGDAILAKNVSFSPMEGNDLSRELELPYFGSQGTVPVELRSTLSFQVELAPSGTAGLPPEWGKLLRACGVAETISAGTSVTYNPITSGAESITFHFTVGSTLFAMRGARGTASFDLTASGIPFIQFEFTALYTSPIEQAAPVPGFANWQRPQEVNTANTSVTLDGNSMIMRSAKMVFGNEVVPRFLVGSASVLITGKSETLEVAVEAVPLSTFNPFAAAEAQTGLPVSLVHGSGAGRIATLSIPAAQMQRPGTPDVQNGILEWPLNLIPVPVAGNDQWTLTLT